jgi:hypothetical protein
VTRDATLMPDRAVPANVAQTAATAGLGPLVRVFVPKRLNWFLLVFGLLIGLATAIILVGFVLLWLMVFRSPNLNPAMNRRRLFLYEHGFVLVEKPDQPQAFRWDGVNAVFQKIVSQRQYGVETARTYLYTVVGRDGRTVKLTQFWKDIAQLGPHINNSVSSALLPGTVAAIEHGQGVQFGDMTVSASGIAGRRKSATWREISQVQIYNGYVRISIAGRFFALSTTAASNIPNLPLFLALTDRLRQGAR